MPPAPQMSMQEPSIFQKLKMGAMMGTGVGLTIGFIFGGATILRSGPGPRGALHTLSQYMLSSAATFGFFLSIGSVIRNDHDNRLLVAPHAQAWQHTDGKTTIRSRADGAALIRARWAAEFARENQRGSQH